MVTQLSANIFIFRMRLINQPNCVIHPGLVLWGRLLCEQAALSSLPFRPGEGEWREGDTERGEGMMERGREGGSVGEKCASVGKGTGGKKIREIEEGMMT